MRTHRRLAVLAAFIVVTFILVVKPVVAHASSGVNGLNGTTAGVEAASGTGLTLGSIYGIGNTGGVNYVGYIQAQKMFPGFSGADFIQVMNANGYYSVANGFNPIQQAYTGGWYLINNPANVADVPVPSGETATISIANRFVPSTTLSPSAPVGTADQALIDTAAEATDLGETLPLVTTFLADASNAISVASWPLMLTGDSVQPSVQSEVDNDCVSDINANDGYPDWSSSDFSTEYHNPYTGLINFTGEQQDMEELASDRIDSIGNEGVICDPALELSRLYTAAQIAEEPWQIRFCIAVQFIDGDGYFWPITVTNGITGGLQYWNWADPSEIAYLDTACPQSTLIAVLGAVTYDDALAGGSPYTPSGDDGTCNIATNEPAGGGPGPADIWMACVGVVALTGMSGNALFCVAETNSYTGSGQEDVAGPPFGTAVSDTPTGSTYSVLVAQVFGLSRYTYQITGEPSTPSCGSPSAVFQLGVVTYNQTTYPAYPATQPNTGIQGPGSSTGSVSTSTTLAALAPPAPGVTAPSTLPSGSSSTPLWGPIEWLGDHISSGITWLGGDITNALGTGLGAVSNGLSQVLGGITSLPSEILGGLKNLFIPDTTPWKGIESGLANVFPFNITGQIADIVGSIGGPLGAAATGSSDCGPVLDFRPVIRDIWTSNSAGDSGLVANMPTPASSGCPAMFATAGKTRTAEENSFGSMFGFRLLIKGFLTLILCLAVLWRFIGSVGPGRTGLEANLDNDQDW